MSYRSSTLSSRVCERMGDQTSLAGLVTMTGVWVPQEQTTGPVATVSSGRGQPRGYDRGQATIRRRREPSPGQPLQEGRLHNQDSELKILRWSPEYKASVYVTHCYLLTSPAAVSRLPGKNDYNEYKLNNRHHRQQQQQQQRGAVHRTDEVPPAERNLLSPMLDAGSNDVEEKEEEVEIKDETAKAVEVTRGIHDTVTSIDTTAFLCSGHSRDPKNFDDSDDQRNASSSSHDIDHTGFVGGSTPPILELGVARKPSEFSTSRDEPSAPSASRTPDGHFSGTIASSADDLTTAGSPTSLKQVRRPRPSRVSRLLQPEGAASEWERADPGAGRAARPQDLRPRRESEQPLQQLVPQPRPTDRDLIQDNVPENVKRANATTLAVSSLPATASARTATWIDYSDVGAIDDVTTIPVKNLSYAFYKDDETEACNDEDQQLDKVSNVLDHRHIRESTDSNLSATDATSQPIAGSEDTQIMPDDARSTATFKSNDTYLLHLQLIEYHIGHLANNLFP
ncbi:hypothetical protein WN51_14310 [Melipona quadrifasciata]|uniref:Uncharacterized protein n=1 Tax=Melipona quadrifasciata TaxID=166423 RepID=A0A0M9A3F9_9HYME|nr:hypothetical protein WN51_14310 [Melipona quadrifasciata]